MKITVDGNAGSSLDENVWNVDGDIKHRLKREMAQDGTELRLAIYNNA